MATCAVFWGHSAEEEEAGRGRAVREQGGSGCAEEAGPSAGFESRRHRPAFCWTARAVGEETACVLGGMRVNWKILQSTFIRGEAACWPISSNGFILSS